MIKQWIRLAAMMIWMLAMVLPAWASEGESELLVKYKPGYHQNTFKANEFAAQEVENTPLSKIGVKKLKGVDEKDMEQLHQDLLQDPAVEYVVVDYVRHALSITSNDPVFTQQWALAKMHLPEAWEMTQGQADVVTAVIDTGVDMDHPDLVNRLAAGHDYINDDDDPDDDNGHGTMAAGIIVAATDNQTQVAGVTWQGKVMPMKVLDSKGNGNDSDVIAAIIDAADQGARVINLSLGGPESSPALQDAINYAYGKGVVIVAASGNHQSYDLEKSVFYPAACDHVIAVGAIDSDSEIAYYSNYGSQMDVVAPGSNIIGLSNDGGLVAGDGTSFAAPHVAGLAALLIAYDDSLTPSQTEVYITNSTTDLGDPGWDEYYGEGLVDAYTALHTLQLDKPGTISGQIIPENGYGLEAIDLLLDGVNVLQNLDDSGYFTIGNIQEGLHHLEISKVGFVTEEWEVHVGLDDMINLGKIDLIYGDLNGDGIVDLFDLVVLSRRVGNSNELPDAVYDPDHDGKISLADLTCIARNYGKQPT